MKQIKNENLELYEKISIIFYEYSVKSKFAPNMKETELYEIISSFKGGSVNDFVIRILKKYPNNIYEFLLKSLYLDSSKNRSLFYRTIKYNSNNLFNGVFNINTSMIMTYGITI